MRARGGEFQINGEVKSGATPLLTRHPPDLVSLRAGQKRSILASEALDSSLVEKVAKLGLIEQHGSKTAAARQGGMSGGAACGTCFPRLATPAEADGMLTRGQKARRSQQQLDAIQALSGHVLELGPVATLLVLQLSVRQLWLLKRVNRYFRRMATAALMTMKRPVVGGGIPQEGGQQSIELLDLGSLRWSVKVLLPAARTDAHDQTKRRGSSGCEGRVG